MGLAPLAHILFNKFMHFNPRNPEWVNRDRFVLSYVPGFGYIYYIYMVGEEWNVDSLLETATVACFNMPYFTSSATISLSTT